MVLKHDHDAYLGSTDAGGIDSRPFWRNYVSGLNAEPRYELGKRSGKLCRDDTSKRGDY